MRTFEFHAYAGLGDGAIGENAEITTRDFMEKSQATSFAGRMAKRIDGPVDVAVAGPEHWEERYVTTANPSEYHASGYRLERLL